jgi:malonate decarboxylase delta subunit
MEHLNFRFAGGRPTPSRAPRLVGVVASGNLEVLVEHTPLGGACEVDVNTAVNGYATIWEAVVRDFFDRHRVGDVRLSINDAGATPATVSLRLDQAIDAFAQGGGR